MEKASFIYKSIYVYRFILNVLYFGKYKQRFRDIIAIFEPKIKTVTELCFGDIEIAEHCKANNIRWIGFDLSKSFVEYANQNGHQAIQTDIIHYEQYSKSDLCIMAGSLYHFHQSPEKIFEIFFKISDNIIISEAIKNLSSSTGFIAEKSQMLTNAGKGKEAFRFTEKTIIDLLNQYQYQFNFKYEIISVKRDILIKIRKI